MSCLTEEMKNKRERKRKSSLLIVDGDLGNMGLYKSILSMEYDLENAFELEDAIKKLEDNEYDVIILDDVFENKELLDFIKSIKKNKREQLICILAERTDNDIVIRCMCNGVNRVIEKPFTRDSLSNGIYEELKAVRDKYIKKHILIVDEDLTNLKKMKEILMDSYDVTIMNCTESGLKFIREYHPNLVIADATTAEKSGILASEDLEKKKESIGLSLLFMTSEPSGESILKCAKYKPDGLLIKPIDMDNLLGCIERLFLVDAYGVRK